MNNGAIYMFRKYSPSNCFSSNTFRIEANEENINRNEGE